MPSSPSKKVKGKKTIKAWAGVRINRIDKWREQDSDEEIYCIYTTRAAAKRVYEVIRPVLITIL